MRKKVSVLLCALTMTATLMTGCASGNTYTQEEYESNYDTGYQAGYEAGVTDGISKGIEQDRAGQVQTMEYATFKKLNEQNKLTCIIYVGRAACPYCGLVTDYMRSVTDLQIPVYYVSLEPYYNSPYYDDYKDELEIDYVPTFIYFKDGEPQYYMDSPVPAGYFDESGEDRVNGYHEMVSTISSFIQGCIDGEPTSVNNIKVWKRGESPYRTAADETTADVTE